MQIFFDPRFVKLIQRELGYDEEVMMKLRRDYMDMYVKLRFNEALVYINEKKLDTEDARIDELADTTLPEKEQAENLDKFFKLIDELIEANPELKHRIDDKLTEYNRELSEQLFNTFSDEAMIEISKFLVEDAKNSIKLSNKFREVSRYPHARNNPNQ